MKPLHLWTMRQLCWLPLILALAVAALATEAWDFAFHRQFDDA